MSIYLRVLLIFASVILISAVVIRIRKAKFQINDGVFWFSLSILILALSVFPQVAEWLADLLGIISPVNLVFLCILAILIIKNFSLSIKVSMLENRLIKMAQRVLVESVCEDKKADAESEKEKGTRQL